MSDLKLLSPHEPSPLERLLMDAASKESPSAEQRARVREALGLPVLGMTPPAPRFSHVGAIVKGAIAGAIVVSALVLQFRSNPGTAVEQAKPAPATQVAPAVAPEIEPKPAADPLPQIAPAPAPLASSNTSRSLRGRAKASPAAPAAEESGTDLSEQLRLIESARAAVAARNAGAAAQALSRYNQQFPRGAFSQEASVLRMQTIDLQGNHAQAASLAKRFLARHPNSPHVGLVQRIAGSSR